MLWLLQLVMSRLPKHGHMTLPKTVTVAICIVWIICCLPQCFGGGSGRRRQQQEAKSGNVSPEAATAVFFAFVSQAMQVLVVLEETSAARTCLYIPV